MTTRTPEIVSRRSDGIGWLIFNNPAKHNAISVDMAKAVPGVMAEFDADPEVRVIVVTGIGERAFAAGSNISGFGDVRKDPEQNRKYNEMNEASYNAVYASPKPTIAMIHGYCIGGGLDFATSCDIRICDDKATFAIPAVRLGLGYGWGGQVRLLRVMGSAQARDLFFTGRRYDAQDALRTGLVHQVVAPEALKDTVVQYARNLARNAPLTIKALKRGFLELEKPESARDISAAQKLIDACFESQDYLEGRAAFAVKREPQFKGE
jgi:enoyl-CoA hydratase/carnithine racemase